LPRGCRPAPGLYCRARTGEAVKPVDHFAAFCQTLTQSDDRWEGQPLKLEPLRLAAGCLPRRRRLATVGRQTGIFLRPPGPFGHRRAGPGECLDGGRVGA
jgi:hypothetical protein